MIKTGAVSQIKKKIKEIILDSKVLCRDCHQQFTKEEVELGNYVFVYGKEDNYFLANDCPSSYFHAIEHKAIKHKTH